MCELLLLGGGGVLAYWFLRRRANGEPLSPVTAIADAAHSVAIRSELGGRWVWPVPRWQGRAPVISDGFHSPRAGIASGLHQGADIMFTRIASDPFPTGPNGTKAFVMPELWSAISAGDGVLWAAGQSPRGWWVVIDHGAVATFYQHLSSLLVPITPAPSKGTPRAQLPAIQAGQPLGVIGADPTEQGHGVKHLHFEVWNGGPTAAIDPAPLLKSFEVVEAAEVARRFRPPLVVAARNAKGGLGPANGNGDLVSVRAHFRSPPRHF